MSDKNSQHEENQKSKMDFLSKITYVLITLWSFFCLHRLFRVNLPLLDTGFLNKEKWWSYFVGINWWWSHLLLGIGSILVAEVIFRSVISKYRRPIKAKLIIGAVLIFSGLTNIFGFMYSLPLLVIGAGIFIVITTLRRRKKQDENSNKVNN